MAGHVAWGLLFGTSAVGFDPRTASDSSCLLIWGANPSHSAPHMDEHWVGEFPGAVVVVDPVATETASRADLHLRPRPGSDAALAFSLLHELRAAGHFDAVFIDAHTIGADELDPLLDPCTPAWGEAQTGVPQTAIREAAALYGAGPALLWAGQGLQRQPEGGNVMRAVGLLPALTGNVGKPGAGFYYLNSTAGIAGADFAWLVGAELAPEAPPAAVSHMDLADRLLGDEFRSFVAWNTNPVASAAEQNRLRDALGREDLFSVVIDCFVTDTARYADIVLPAASFLEFDDVTASYMNLRVGAQVKASEPEGEALPNMEIFRRLARAMDFQDDALFASDRDLLDTLLGQMNLGVDFAGLAARGSVPLAERPVILHEDLRFETPSGHIEIASERAERRGLPRLPQPSIDAAPAGDRFRLLSPASKWRLNDSFANEAKLDVRAGSATVVIHPEDAERRGIAAGNRVRLENEAGAIELVAEVSALASPGVLVSYKGRWPGREDSDANVNVLHTARKTDMGESSAVHGVEVTLALSP